LAMNAPIRPFTNSSAVSSVVSLALKRAGIENPPSRGAHMLRHSAATAMLRAGSPLETIASVLRHKSPDMAAYYAKIDVGTLGLVVQPWAGGAP
jgi:integrase